MWQCSGRCAIISWYACSSRSVSWITPSSTNTVPYVDERNTRMNLTALTLTRQHPLDLEVRSPGPARPARERRRLDRIAAVLRRAGPRRLPDAARRRRSTRRSVASRALLERRLAHGIAEALEQNIPRSAPTMHRQVLGGAIAPTYWGRSALWTAAYRAELLRCCEAIRRLHPRGHCAPRRAARRRSGAGACTVTSWPTCAARTAAFRFEQFLSHGANAGLAKGIAFLREFTEAPPRSAGPTSSSSRRRRRSSAWAAPKFR